MQPDIQEVTREVEHYSHLTAAIAAELKKVIVGQDYLVERLLIGLLADGIFCWREFPVWQKPLQ